MILKPDGALGGVAGGLGSLEAPVATVRLSIHIVCA